MRRSFGFLLGAAMAVGVLPSLANADSGLRQPPGVTQAAFLDAEAACDAACAEIGYDQASECNQCGCGQCGSASDDIFLSSVLGPYMQVKECAKNCYGLDIGGWIQAGMTANAQDPHDRYNGPVLTNDRVGDLQMNQFWFYAHKTVDNGGCGFDAGGRVDVFYGTDWRAAALHGYGMEEERLNGPDQLYGLSIPQMYAEFAYNDLSVKMGRMTGIVGYEIAPAPGSFFYSHSMAIAYGEPILITGLMSNYKYSDHLTLLGGFHQGMHQFENNNGTINLQAGAMWTNCDERLSLAYAFDIGRNNFLPGMLFLEDEYLHSLVLKYQVTERLLYVAQNDYGYANGAAGFEDADWYSIGQYLLYAINEKWSAGARVEWFRDDDGTRVLGAGNLDAEGWDGLPGFEGSFTSLTMGLNWKPKLNVLVRPEARWDWYDGSTNWGGQLPFDDYTSNDQFTLATDVVIMF
jgi:hypothetical protein